MTEATIQERPTDQYLLHKLFPAELLAKSDDKAHRDIPGVVILYQAIRLNDRPAPWSFPGLFFFTTD